MQKTIINRSVIIFNNNKNNILDSSINLIFVTDNTSQGEVVDKREIYIKSFLKNKNHQEINKTNKFIYSFSI